MTVVIVDLDISERMLDKAEAFTSTTQIDVEVWLAYLRLLRSSLAVCANEDRPRAERVLRRTHEMLDTLMLVEDGGVTLRKLIAEETAP